MQAEVLGVGPSGLPIRHQQEGVGHDADKREGDEGEPHEARTLSHAHGEVVDRQRVKVSRRPAGRKTSLEQGAKVSEEVWQKLDRQDLG